MLTGHAQEVDPRLEPLGREPLHLRIRNDVGVEPQPPHDRSSRAVGTTSKPASNNRRKMIQAAASGSSTSAGKSPLPSKSISTSSGRSSRFAVMTAPPGSTRGG